jgi:hypothetical protein
LDDNTLLVIQKVLENQKAFIAMVAAINQKIRAMYSFYNAELSEPKSIMIPILQPENNSVSGESSL